MLHLCLNLIFIRVQPFLLCLLITLVRSKFLCDGFSKTLPQISRTTKSAQPPFTLSGSYVVVSLLSFYSHKYHAILSSRGPFELDMNSRISRKKLEYYDTENEILSSRLSGYSKLLEAFVHTYENQLLSKLKRESIKNRNNIALKI